MIRVFIVAASPLVRAGLENLLAARDVEVVGSTATMETIAGQLSDAAPDVVLMDSSGEPVEPMLESIFASGSRRNLKSRSILGSCTSIQKRPKTKSARRKPRGGRSFL